MNRVTSGARGLVSLAGVSMRLGVAAAAGLLFASTMTMSPGTARAQEPAPVVAGASAEGAASGGRRIIDIELAPLYSIPDAFALCLEAFPMRQGLAVEGCASIELIEAAAFSLSASYRVPVYRGPS